MATTREKISTTMNCLGIEADDLTRQDAQLLGYPNHRQLSPSPQSIISNPELQSELGRDFESFLRQAISNDLIPNLQNISLREASSHQLRETHLNALNKPLEENGLPKYFSFDQFRMGGQDAPVLLKTNNVKHLGDGFFMVELMWSTGVIDDNIKVGKFKAIAPDISRSEVKGAYQLCITDSRNSIGSIKDVKNRVNINDTELRKINVLRRELNLPVFSDQSKDQENSPSFKDVITYDQNKNYYIPQVLVDENGQENIIISNTLKNGSAGTIGLIVYPDNSIGLIYNSRPLQNRPIELELPRGFPNTLVSELEAETGLKPEWITQSYPIIQGRYDHTHPDVQVLRLDEFVGMSVPDNYKSPEETPGDHLSDKQLTEFEAISHLILKPKEVLENIRNGSIRDAFTLSIIGKLLVDDKSIILNPIYRDRGLNILMEIKYFPQLGKYLPVIPEGLHDSGVKVGEVLPNSGMIIGGGNITSVGFKDIEKNTGHFIQFPIEKITKLITKPNTCDMVTRAALFEGLYNQSILIEPERIAISTSYRK